MSINLNIAVGVMSSYRLRESSEACKNNWLKDFKNKFLFGGFKKANGLVSLGRIGEDWTSAFLKQQLGLKYMYNVNPFLDWYSIFGTDNILFKNSIENILFNYNPSHKIFIGKRLKKITIENHEFMCLAGGGGFFISNALMCEIYNFLDDFNIIWYNLYKSRKHEFPFGASDIAISFMLSKYFGIQLKDINGFYSDHPRTYSYKIQNPIVLHYIKPDEMSEIYNQYF